MLNDLFGLAARMHGEGDLLPTLAHIVLAIAAMVLGVAIMWGAQCVSC